VIRRVRALANKTDIEKVPLKVNDVVAEIIARVQRELISHRVSFRTEFAPALPMILGDRVQLYGIGQRSLCKSIIVLDEQSVETSISGFIEQPTPRPYGPKLHALRRQIIAKPTILLDVRATRTCGCAASGRCRSQVPIQNQDKLCDLLVIGCSRKNDLILLLVSPLSLAALPFSAFLAPEPWTMRLVSTSFCLR
jgi:hypothetical protein